MSQVVGQAQGKARVTRQASRRLVSLPKAAEEEPMEVEAEARPVNDRGFLERVIPEGVEDIDKRDGENPQLCSEYALEVRDAENGSVELHSRIGLATFNRLVCPGYLNTLFHL